MTYWGFIENAFVSPPNTNNMNMFEMPQMQFTGLKDKNEKEIYEGDILRTEYNDGLPAVVEYHAKNSERHPINGWVGNVKDDWIIIYPEKMEVIGNAMENPELLK